MDIAAIYVECTVKSLRFFCDIVINRKYTLLENDMFFL